MLTVPYIDCSIKNGAYMKQKLCYFIALCMACTLASQEFDASKIVFFEKNVENQYQFVQNDRTLSTDEALDFFLLCPENESEIFFYKSARSSGQIMSVSGLSIVSGTAFFSLITLLTEKSDDFKEIQMYGALSGSIIFVAGIISLQIASMRLKRAHKNYNVYVMGLPVGAF